MIKIWLTTRPNHDLTTNYLSSWMGLVFNQAKKSGIKVLDLKGKRANKKELTSMVYKLKPDLIVFNGHGDEMTITGNDDNILIKEGVNDNLLKDKIIYAIACRSAKSLGVSAISKGAKAYIGYNEDFIFLIDEKFISKPLMDKTAALFLNPSNYLVLCLLKGHHPKDSYEKSKSAYKRNIEKLMTSEASKEDKEVLPYLIWNMKHQVCL